MCDGCWFGSSACVGAEKAYALAPVNGQSNGMDMPGVTISKDDARISVAFCAERMKNELNCSKQFIGVSKKDGQCWCAKESDNCDNFAGFTKYIGHFFQVKEGSKKNSEGVSERVFEGAVAVDSARRLSTACTRVHAFICVFSGLLVKCQIIMGALSHSIRVPR